MTLQPVKCEYCGKYLADVPRASMTLCPDCKKWSASETETEKEKQLSMASE
jgi:phage FluMu protein Com